MCTYLAGLKEVGKKNNVIKNDKYEGCDKLVPHLMKHEKYVLHYRNLTVSYTHLTLPTIYSV